MQKKVLNHDNDIMHLLLDGWYIEYKKVQGLEGSRAKGRHLLNNPFVKRHAFS